MYLTTTGGSEWKVSAPQAVSKVVKNSAKIGRNNHVTFIPCNLIKYKWIGWTNRHKHFVR